MTFGAISGGFGGPGGFGGFGGGGFGGIQAGQRPDFSQIQSQKAEAFSAANTDGEEGLTLDEFSELKANSPFGARESSNAPSTEDVFSAFDSNEDGILSEDEFVNRQPPGPGSKFSSDAFASLISLQEDGGSSLIDSLLNSTSTEESDGEESEDDLISALSELADGEDEATSDLASQLLDILSGEPA